ncbi:predicted protein [Sclerotinia sclerotiorum 1980 UF-70]|uniref:Uncharacterized protein n=1 Tax=Sclerotinia sclerotiorum (strain ATCC 18683 / 1980 / Ss-1) TaxID=665079 RepID=A7E7Z3_SCLS1|nr:predicted protein [Sclerotinia sclerotiorum 1980 UF-70]EDN96495.1 predicted protein [Sclerotinia sclerotiorum 1980 UF-70]
MSQFIDICVRPTILQIDRAIEVFSYVHDVRRDLPTRLPSVYGAPHTHPPPPNQTSDFAKSTKNIKLIFLYELHLSTQIPQNHALIILH